MIDGIGLKTSHGKGPAWIGVGAVDVKPVVDASRSFALTNRAREREKKRRDAFFKLKPGGNVDEGVENSREDSKLVEEAELLSLVAFGDVLETRVSEKSGFESGAHGSFIVLLVRAWRRGARRHRRKASLREQILPSLRLAW